MVTGYFANLSNILPTLNQATLQGYSIGTSFVLSGLAFGYKNKALGGYGNCITYIALILILLFSQF